MGEVIGQKHPLLVLEKVFHGGPTLDLMLVNGGAACSSTFFMPKSKRMEGPCSSLGSDPWAAKAQQLQQVWIAWEEERALVEKSSSWSLLQSLELFLTKVDEMGHSFFTLILQLERVIPRYTNMLGVNVLVLSNTHEPRSITTSTFLILVISTSIRIFLLCLADNKNSMLLKKAHDMKIMKS